MLQEGILEPFCDAYLNNNYPVFAVYKSKPCISRSRV